MNDVSAWATLGGSFLLFLGTVITVLATRGKTRTDYKTAFDQRIDKRMGEYTDRLEEREAKLEARVSDLEIERAELTNRVECLETAQEASTKREQMLYRYTARLRNHIFTQAPPPPPDLPEELVEWYNSHELGKGSS